LAVPRPREGLWRGENFWLRLTTASAQCLRLSEGFFHFTLFIFQQDYAKINQPIFFTKLGGKVARGPWGKQLDLGDNSNPDPDQGIFD